MGYAKVLVGVLFLFIAVATTSAAFTCTTNTTTTNSTCRSLIDYVPVNNTNLFAVQSLFQIKRFHDLLGANDFSTSTSPNQTLPAKQRIKIPFSCRCENGTGVSDKPPVYTVKEGDVGLYNIAFFTFSNVVTYPEIAKFNRLPNPDKIMVGQNLSIPLPCSCDEVDGVEVVHYGHVVESGSSVDKIAAEYGTTPAILLQLNNMTNASQLQADQVLDVPLKGFLPFTFLPLLCFAQLFSLLLFG
nr:lysM domain-containing GPI-anchored protein 2-like [Quercus suber]